MPQTSSRRSGRFINGEAVRVIRELSGISQVDVARQLGYADSTYVSKLETGIIRQPNAALINRLAEALGVNPAAISYLATVICDHDAEAAVA